jgi:hypothetical protein
MLLHPSIRTASLLRLLVLVPALVALQLSVWAEGYPSIPRADQKHIYGFMIDAARVPESMAYYERLVDFCSRWGYNAIILRLTDDQGSALKFKSHPEFLTHRNALSSADITHLVSYSKARGIEIIPEVESFGHSRYITSVSQYADLMDKDMIHPDKRSPDFSGLIPSHPRTLALMKDLFREISALFPSTYMHAGCDEVNWGGSEYSRRELQTHDRAHLWAKYINSLDDIAKSLGKELIIWGDHPLRVDPEVLPFLNKDIIIMDWNYSESDPEALKATARIVLQHGLRLIGAPALTHCGWGPRVATSQLRNVDAFEQAYNQIGSQQILGLVVTNWLPGRYIQDAIWDEIAYAGVSIREGSLLARQHAFEYFVERHYEASWDEKWAGLFSAYYDRTPYFTSHCKQGGASAKLVGPWHDVQGLSALVSDASQTVPDFELILKELDSLKPMVRRNKKDYEAFRLSLEYMLHLFLRNTLVLNELGKDHVDPESSAATIRKIAQRDQQLLQALNASWDRDRPSDSEAKATLVFPAREDQLLFRFAEAAAYSQTLVNHPEMFVSILIQIKDAKTSPTNATGPQ